MMLEHISDRFRPISVDFSCFFIEKTKKVQILMKSLCNSLISALQEIQGKSGFFASQNPQLLGLGIAKPSVKRIFRQSQDTLRSSRSSILELVSEKNSIEGQSALNLPKSPSAPQLGPRSGKSSKNRKFDITFFLAFGVRDRKTFRKTHFQTVLGYPEVLQKPDFGVRVSKNWSKVKISIFGGFSGSGPSWGAEGHFDQISATLTFDHFFDSLTPKSGFQRTSGYPRSF